MSQFSEKVNSHPLQDTLRTLESLIDEMDASDFQKQEEAISAFERIKQVFIQTKKRINGTDPNLIPIQHLTNLNASYQKIVAEVSAFKTNNNAAHLTTANSHIENILVYLSYIIVPITSEDFADLREVATSYRRSIGQSLRLIDEESNSLKEAVNKIKNETTQFSTEIQTQKERIDKIINNFQEQFSASEEKRRDEFTNAESARKEKADTLFKEKETQWDELTEEKNQALEALHKKTEIEMRRLSSLTKSSAEGIIEQINESKGKAEKLVGIITNTGMVGGYQRIANDEKKLARNWGVLAAASLVSLIGFAIFAFIETLGVDFKWSTFGGRAFVATACGILAAYAALQADKHQKTERKNRKLELELASISPYLHDLPIKEQHRIKAELAMRLFGTPEPLEGKIDNKTTGSVLDILKMAVDAIETLAKK